MVVNRFVDLITLSDSQELFNGVRVALRQYFSSRSIIYPIKSKKLSESCGVFITFKDRKGEVRGSMGLLETDLPLSRAAIDCAISAVKDDPRYRKILANEVDSTAIELTLIREIEDITGNLNGARNSFVIGTHGFYVEGKLQAGVLLPREIYDLKLDFDKAVERAKVKCGISSSEAGIKYYMFSARVFLQEAEGATAIQLS